jgi:hypothetical protein
MPSTKYGYAVALALFKVTVGNIAIRACSIVLPADNEEDAIDTALRMDTVVLDLADGWQVGSQACSPVTVDQD